MMGPTRVGIGNTVISALGLLTSQHSETLQKPTGGFCSRQDSAVSEAGPGVVPRAEGA